MGAMAKTELSIKVGAAIRQARKQRGLVMRHIAEHNDTDVAAVGNWETGRNLPKTENLLKTAAFLALRVRSRSGSTGPKASSPCRSWSTSTAAVG